MPLTRLFREGSPALLVAQHILWLRRNKETTPMQLLKLIYICHGISLALTGKPLIRESVVAWAYGPVIPTIYHAFKDFGSSPITIMGAEQPTLSEDQRLLVREMVDAHNKFDGLQLSAMTHAPGTPWDTTVKESGVGSVIDDDLIQSYYEEGLREPSPSLGR